MKPPSNFARVLIVLLMLGAIWFVGWTWTDGAPSLRAKFSPTEVGATVKGSGRTAWEGFKESFPTVWRKLVGRSRGWFRSEVVPFVRDEVVPLSQRVAEETQQGWREGDESSMDVTK